VLRWFGEMPAPFFWFSAADFFLELHQKWIEKATNSGYFLF
jgi:hypothetical protein